jgi:hypothetical protein
MPEVEAHRRLVKSPPELWAELSDVEALARHLGEFGDIRITRTDPETALAWEGEHARGTVSIESSGWGTKVRLTAEAIRPEPEEPAAEEPEPVAEEREPVAEEPEPVAEEPEPVTEEPEPVPEEREPVPEEPATVAELPAPQPPPRKIGFFARLFGRRKRAERVLAAPEPAPAPEPVPEPEPVAVQPVPEPETLPEPVAVQPEPEPEPVAIEPEPEPEPALPDAEGTVSDERVLDVLTSTLDALGQAHHRPFSRG